MLRRPTYALSLKQPWAALVVAGRKTIEVRKWPTRIRGRVYIHSAKLADDRPQAWDLVPDDLTPVAQLRGGIIGSVELTGCILYRTLGRFAADTSQHLNRPEWFEPPRMYGFLVRGCLQTSLFPCNGYVRFFSVEIPVNT
jgi:ASCH domain